MRATGLGKTESLANTISFFDILLVLGAPSGPSWRLRGTPGGLPGSPGVSYPLLRNLRSVLNFPFNPLSCNIHEITTCAGDMFIFVGLAR